MIAMTLGDLAQIIVAVLCTVAALVGAYAIYRLTQRDTRKALKYDGDLQAVKQSLNIIDQVVEEVKASPRSASELDKLGLTDVVSTIRSLRNDLPEVGGHLALVSSLCAALKVNAFPEEDGYEFRRIADESGKIDVARFQEVFRRVGSNMINQHLAADELKKSLEETRIRLDRVYR